MQTSTSYVPLLLLETRVDADTREITRDEELVEFDGASNRLHEDDDLETDKAIRRDVLKTLQKYLIEFECV